MYRFLQWFNQELPEVWYPRCAVGITIFGLLFRLFCFWMESTISRDGVFYCTMAEIWKAEGFEAARQLPLGRVVPPLLPGLMRLMMYAGISAEFAGNLLNLLSGTLLIPILYWIGVMCFNRREIALGLALLAAVQPSLVELSIEIQRDAPYLLFAGLAIGCTLAATEKQKVWRWVLAGFFCTAAAMMRLEGLELVPLFLGYIVVLMVLQFLTVPLGLKAAVSFIGGCIGGFLLLTLLVGIPWDFYSVYWERGVELFSREMGEIQ